jgi:hypothetical protein
MESFTQPDTSFPNCFSCHDTRGATGQGGALRSRSGRADP